MKTSSKTQTLNFLNAKWEYKRQVNIEFLCTVLHCTVFSQIVTGPRMACFTVQQQPEWNPSRRDGSWQNHPDHCSHHISNGEKESEWTIPHHCSSVVRTSL